MTFDDSFANGEANPGSFIAARFAMEPLEGGKDRFKVFLVKPNSIVLNENLMVFIAAVRRHFHQRLFILFMKLKSVADEVLEQFPGWIPRSSAKPQSIP